MKVIKLHLHICDKIEQLLPVGLIYVFFETIALVFSYSEPFSSIHQFLLVQDVALAPIILTGIELAYNIDPVINRFEMNDTFRHLIFMVVILMLIVFLSICSCRISIFNYLFKWPFERLIFFLFEFCCMIGIEVDKCSLDNDIHNYFVND